MAVVRHEDGTRLEIDGATVQLVAGVTGVEAAARRGGLAYVYAGPRRVEVQHDDGRLDTARVRDLDRWARCAMVTVGAVAFAVGRRRRRKR